MPDPTNGRGARAAPWVSLRGAALAFALSVALCWPMLYFGGPLLYFDSLGNLAVGGSMLDLVTDHAERLFDSGGPAPDPSAAGAAGLGGEDAAGLRLRAVVYPLFVKVSSLSPLGLAGTTLIQTTLTLLVLFAFLPGDRSAVSPAALGAAAFVVFCTTLPWFASYAMPDILAALVVIFYAIALRRIDDLTPLQTFTLALLAFAAIAAHYGNIPLATGLAIVVLAWRMVARRLTTRALLACVLPIVAASGLNLSVSTAALDAPSVAPKRLPILLARSLEDGPALWYLQEACPEADYAMCEVFDPIPSSVGTFLWTDAGLAGVSPDDIDRIRAEETAILIAAFRAYPVAQTRALLGNAALQTITVGTGEMIPGWLRNEAGDGFVDASLESAGRDPVIATFDRILPLTTAASLLLFPILALRRRIPPQITEAALVVLVGLVINAAIFGGLSFPVDRYQSRIVWVLPALLAVGLLHDHGRRRSPRVPEPA